MHQSPYHLQKPARKDDQLIDVDHQLVEILEWCWEEGMETEFSCQGDDREKGYIMFSSASDAEQFLAQVSLLSEELRGKAHAVQPYEGAETRGWDLVAFPTGDCCGAWNDPECERPLQSRIRISVLIPNRDLNLLRGTLQHSALVEA